MDKVEDDHEEDGPDDDVLSDILGVPMPVDDLDASGLSGDVSSFVAGHVSGMTPLRRAERTRGDDNVQPSPHILTHGSPRDSELLDADGMRELNSQASFSDNEPDEAKAPSVAQRSIRSQQRVGPRVKNVSARSGMEAAAIKAEVKRQIASGSSAPAPVARASGAMNRYGSRSQVHTAHVVVSGTQSTLQQAGILKAAREESDPDLRLHRDETFYVQSPLQSVAAGVATQSSEIVSDLAQTLGPPTRFHLFAGGRLLPEVLQTVFEYQYETQQAKPDRQRHDRWSASAFRSFIWLTGRVGPAIDALNALSSASAMFPSEAHLQSRRWNPFPSHLYQHRVIRSIGTPRPMLPTTSSASLIIAPQVYPFVSQNGEFSHPPAEDFSLRKVVAPLDGSGKGSTTSRAGDAAGGADASDHLYAVGACRFLPASCKDLRNKRFVAASANWAHALLLTASGDVYQWQLSSQDPLADVEPTPLPSPLLESKDETVVMKPRAATASTPVPEKEQLSEADRAAIALGPVLVQSLAWERALKGIRIVAVACGTQHCVALSSAPYFDVYTWGCGADGRLGHGGTRNEPDPRVVTALIPFRVTSISAGGAHTAAITMGGVEIHASEMFHAQMSEAPESARGGDFASSPLHTDTKSAYTSSVVSTISAVSSASIRHHEEAKSGDDSLGAVWTWGRGANGRLGHGSTDDAHTPRRVRGIVRVKHRILDLTGAGASEKAAASNVAGGTPPTAAQTQKFRSAYSFTSRRAVAASTTASPTPAQVLEHLRVGSFSAGQLSTSTKVLRERAVCLQVACGRSFTIAVTADGDVWSWGKSSNGQTGLDSKRLQAAANASAAVSVAKSKMPSGLSTDLSLNGDVVTPCRVMFPRYLHLQTREHLTICARTVHEFMDPTTATLCTPLPLEGSTRPQVLNRYPGLFSVPERSHRKRPTNEESALNLFVQSSSKDLGRPAPPRGRGGTIDGGDSSSRHEDDAVSLDTEGGDGRASVLGRGGAAGGVGEVIDPVAWATGTPQTKAASGEDAMQETIDVPDDCVRVVRIAAGHSHVVCTARDGTVWSWGLNDFGQIGVGFDSTSRKTVNTPVQVPVHMWLDSRADGILKASTARASSAVATAERERANLTGPGSASYVSNDNIVTLHGVHFARDPVVAVFAGAFHTIAATAGGAILAWGRNHEGALGQFQQQGKAEPNLVQVNVKVSVVDPSSSEHRRKNTATDSERRDSGAEVTTVEEGASAMPDAPPSTLASPSEKHLSVIIGRPWRRVLDIACGKDFSIFLEAQVVQQDLKAVTLNASQVPKVTPGAPRTSKLLSGAELDELQAAALLETTPIKGHREASGEDTTGEDGTLRKAVSTLSPDESMRPAGSGKPVKSTRSHRDRDNMTADSASTMGNSVSAPIAANVHGRFNRSLHEGEIKRREDEFKAMVARRKAEEHRLVSLLSDWQRFLDSFFGDFQYAMLVDTQLHKLWRQGIPPQLRGRLWLLAIGNAACITPAAFDLARQRAIFMKRQKLRGRGGEGRGSITARPSRAFSSDRSADGSESHARGDSSDDLRSLPPLSDRAHAMQSPTSRMISHGKERTIDDIATDLDRTFPALHLFGPEKTPSEGPLGQVLSDVLEALTVHRPELGYVQGMSYIAAMLCVFLGGQSVAATSRRPEGLPVGMNLDVKPPATDSPLMNPPIAPRYSACTVPPPPAKGGGSSSTGAVQPPPGSIACVTTLEAETNVPPMDTLFNRAVSAVRPIIAALAPPSTMFVRLRTRDVLQTLSPEESAARAAVDAKKPRASLKTESSSSGGLFSFLFSSSSAAPPPPPPGPVPRRHRIHRAVGAPERSTPALLVAEDRYLVFQALSNMLNKHHLYLFYSMDPSCTAPFYQLFDRFLASHNPMLAEHLSDCGIAAEMYLLPWFQTIFLKALPLATAAYIWDLYLLEGMPILYRSAMALLDLLSPFMLTDSPSFEETMQLFSQSPAKKGIWERINQLYVFVPVLESMTFPTAIALELQDLVNDPFFYRYVGGGRDVHTGSDGSVDTKGRPAGEDGGRPKLPPAGASRSRTFSWSSLASAVGQGVSAVSVSEEMSEEGPGSTTASLVSNAQVKDVMQRLDRVI